MEVVIFERYDSKGMIGKLSLYTLDFPIITFIIFPCIPNIVFILFQFVSKVKYFGL